MSSTRCSTSQSSNLGARAVLESAEVEADGPLDEEEEEEGGIGSMKGLSVPPLDVRWFNRRFDAHPPLEVIREREESKAVGTTSLWRPSLDSNPLMHVRPWHKVPLNPALCSEPPQIFRYAAMSIDPRPTALLAMWLKKTRSETKKGPSGGGSHLDLHAR